MYRTLKFTLCLGLLFSFAGTAKAVDQTFGPTAFGTFSAGAGGSFNLPQFDPSLGTLNSILVSITGNSLGGSNSIDNESLNPGNASVSIGTNINVTGPSSLLILTTPLQSNSGPVTADTDIAADFIGTDSLTVIGSSSTDTDTDTLFGGFGPYTGLGNVSFNYTSGTNTSSSADVSPAQTLSNPTTFDFTATITYSYTPVPEPGSIALVAFAGLAAVGYSVRRRKIA